MVLRRLRSLLLKHHLKRIPVEWEDIVLTVRPPTYRSTCFLTDETLYYTTGIFSTTSRICPIEPRYVPVYDTTLNTLFFVNPDSDTIQHNFLENIPEAFAERIGEAICGETFIVSSHGHYEGGWKDWPVRDVLREFQRNTPDKAIETVS